MAALAYPNHCGLRDQFFRAICRHEVLTRALKDDDYQTTPQLIPPAIFLDRHDKVTSVLRKGIERLRGRLVATVTVLFPYLGQVEVNGKIITIKELSETALTFLGWSSGSSSNVISKVWVDTRAVAHVATVDVLRRLTNFPNVPFELCPEASLVAQLIEASENVRQQIGTIKHRQHSRPLIMQDDMIEFVGE